MKVLRIKTIFLGVVISLLSSTSIASAQNIKDAAAKSGETVETKCDAKHSEPEKATLPVANTDAEYKTYIEIVSLQNPDELLSRSRDFLAKNVSSDLRFPLYQNMVTASIRMGDFDKAFAVGKEALVEFPQHVMVMTQLAAVASNQMLIGNSKYGNEGSSFACQALAFIKQDQMPFGYTLEKWKPYRDSLLGDVHQAIGIFRFFDDCPEEAALAFTQALKYHPNDAYTHFLLAKVQVRLYQWGTRNPVAYQPSPQTEAPKNLLEQIARTYAAASVLTEGEQYKLLRDAIDYDLMILNKALGKPLQEEFARAVDAERNRMNAEFARPPAAAAATERP